MEQANCADCQTAFTDQTLQVKGGLDRSPGGDEYFDEIHRCPSCDTWWMVTFVDRFAGPDEIKIRGPLSDDELKEQRERMST